MDRIISWKINSSKYAYIVKVNGDSHISNRITDSSTIQDIIDEVEGWGSNAETKYKANYKELSEEVSKTYGIQMPEKWEEFYSYKNGYSGITNTNLVILTGKDGNGSGSGDGSNLLSEEDWNRLEEEIKNKLAAQSAWTREQIDKVNGYVTEMVNEEIKNANKRIDDAKQDLEDAKKKLEGDIDDAQKDLDSFASGITNLDTEAIKNSISGLSSVQQWLKDYSGKTVEIIADYDDAMKTGGLIGTSTDATIGLFSRYAICLNNVSGTVGQVNSYMQACAATIGNVAKWYDGSASSMTELQSYIDAKKGVIAQLADFIDNSANTQNSIARIVDARAASITDKATSSSDGNLNTITNEINALSGYVHTSLVTQDKYTSGITSITSTMDSMKGEITRALTIQKELSGDVTSLAESWNEESGKLSTVYNLVYDEETGGYSEALGSYIQQCTDHISLNINSGDIYAALNLRVTDDGKSLIYADADEIMLNGEVIGESLRFTKGNIGGIYLGQGRIVQTGGMWELNSAGTLLAKNASISGNVYATDGVFSGSVYATDGYFKGDIVANTLTLGADYGNQTLMEYISEKTGGSGVTTGEVNSLITQYLSSTAFTNTMTKNGYITESDMEEYISSLDLDGQGIDGEKLSALCKTLVGAEISNVFGSSANSDGSITHSVKIGDKTYEWTTYDAGKYLVVDSALSGESGSSFVVSKQGLLQANNAVIYGKIYASEGEFRGDLVAKNGKFGILSIGEDGGRSQLAGTSFQSDSSYTNSIRIRPDILEMTAEHFVLSDPSFSTSFTSPTSEKPYLLNYKTITYTNNVTKVADMENTSAEVISKWGTISKVVQYYLVTSNDGEVSVPSFDLFSTTLNGTLSPIRRYLWNYMKITYTSSMTANTTPTIIGEYRGVGWGISKVVDYYGISSGYVQYDAVSINPLWDPDACDSNAIVNIVSQYASRPSLYCEGTATFGTDVNVYGALNASSFKIPVKGTKTEVKISIVSSLPSTKDANTIYLVV